MSDGFLKEVAMPPKAAKQHAERAVPVGTNFLLGRAKSCQWQVFVRRRPPKQGELRTDVSKATMFQGDRKVSKFLPYFLYFTTSRRKTPRSGGRLPQATQKGGAAADNSAKRKDLLRQQQKVPPRATQKPRSGKRI